MLSFWLSQAFGSNSESFCVHNLDPLQHIKSLDPVWLISSDSMFHFVILDNLVFLNDIWKHSLWTFLQT